MEMRFYTCVISVGVILSFVHAVQGEIKGQFSTLSNSKVKLNEIMKFNCTFTTDTPQDIFTSEMEIYRKSSNKKIILAEKGILQSDAPPEFYELAFNAQYDINKYTMQFTILKVRDVDDGKLYCGLTKSGSLTEYNVDIIVLRPLTGLQLILNEGMPITKDQDSQIEVKSGTHKVKCVAEGSNPAAKSIELYLHGVKHPDSRFKSEAMGTALAQYRTILEADIYIASSNSGQDLECKATSEYENSKSVKVPLKVIIDEPHVECNDTFAFKGERDAKITCIVDHRNSKLKGFKYQIGNDIYLSGSDRGPIHYVDIKDVSDGDSKLTEVSLVLEKVEESHFDSEIFVLAEHEDGHISKMQIKLFKTEEGRSRDTENKTDVLKVSMAVVWLSLICVLGRGFF